MQIELKDPAEFQRLLLLKGFSQRSFAEELALSAAYFNQIVNERRRPSAKVAKKIADRLEVEFDTIFFIKNAC
jgi:transcriptional regulator with XRE-family HTH domain